MAPQPFYEDRGTPIAIRQVLEALTQLGFEVDVVTYAVGRPVDLPGVRYFRGPNPLRFRHVPIGFSVRKLLLDVLLVPVVWGRLRRGGYACIHAVEEAGFLAVALGRRFRVPVIYDMQSSLPEQMAKLPGFRSRPARAALRAAERWLLRRADRVVTSEGLAQRVRAVAPGAEVRQWRYSSRVPTVPAAAVAALRRELRIPPDSSVVLYSGTFEPYQGLRELVRAIPLVLEKHPATVFVLAGAGGSDAPVLALGARDLIRRGVLRFVKRQPRDAIPAYVALADVLVSPRAHGGNLPLKVFDYLAAGKPIVATAIPAHLSLLDHTRAELAEPSAAGLARAISRLLGDGARAEDLAAAARQFAEEHLGWIPFVKSLADLYGQLEAAAPRAPQPAAAGGEQALGRELLASPR